MEIKNIVIIGAGYAGVHAAKKLAKKYKKDTSVTITLIDQHSYHTMMTELHEVAAHRVEPEAIKFDLRKLFKHTKVNLVTDKVTNVDHEKKTVTTEHAAYSYDYLILGMGGEPNDFGTPGVREHGFTLMSWEEAVKLRAHIEQIVRKAATEHDVEKRHAMLTFAICGSGFTGVEMIGELIEWKTRLARVNKLAENDISLYLVEAVPTILNMLERKDAGKAENYMRKKGVTILTSSPIVEVKADRIILKSGDELPTHTLIWTAGVKANSQANIFGMKSARAGRLTVNKYMEADGLENVYVVGDLSYYEDGGGKPVPQIVEAAEQTAGTAVKNITSAISGGEKSAFKGSYHGVMVSIGARYGVAHLGSIHLSGFFANLMKHMVNLYYFFGLRSAHYMFHYIMHEFFQTKDKRNIFRNFSTRYGNVLWGLPLRVFVGGFWLNEAFGKIWGESVWNKVTSHWSNIHLLFNGLGKDSWLVGSSVKMPFDWLQTATTGASQAASSAGDAASQYATPILSKMPFWFEWIMKLMLPNADVAVFMQKSMVFIELAIGLALLAGLFTWISSAASAGFIVMFTLSAMLGWNNLWAFPASIALMNGSGRSVGFDYWVVPFLQKTLSRWWYGKEQAIYNDAADNESPALIKPSNTNNMNQ